MLPWINPTFRCVAVEYPAGAHIGRSVCCRRIAGQWHGQLAHAPHRIAAELVGLLPEQFVERLDQNEDGVVHQCGLCLFCVRIVRQRQRNATEKRNNNLRRL